MHPGITTIVNRSDFEFVSARNFRQGLAHGVTWENNASSRLHRSVGLQCKKNVPQLLANFEGVEKENTESNLEKG